MSIDHLRAHWGLTRMPFSKDLAPSMLAATSAHNQAVARISWCIAESALGVITGEVGAGKTVATRAAISSLDVSRHTIIYIGNPAVGARGETLGQRRLFHRVATYRRRAGRPPRTSGPMFVAAGGSERYLPGRVSCEKPRALMSRKAGVSGGSFAGSRKFVSNENCRVGTP